MKVSYNWLNKRFFNDSLPAPEIVAEELTMKSFEVDSIEKIDSINDTILDVKILPDRSHDCLSHKGIAREISVMSGSSHPIAYNPEKPQPSSSIKTSDFISASIDAQGLCHRVNKRLIKGIKVGPSPKWLSDYLSAMGSRSINNVVDATNFVMFETGQPVHAFDLDKISDVDGYKKIVLRRAKPGEEIVCLDEKKYVLDPSMVVWADEKRALDIAGIKGGADSGIDDQTSNIVISACNFDAVSIRLTAKKLGLRTDASVRFENEISPEIIPEAVDLVSAIIQKVAGGEVAEDVLDIYPRPKKPYVVGVSVDEVEKLLGIKITEKVVGELFSRANFNYRLVEPLSDILDRAKTLIGRPYKWGASILADAPDRFDCSSFVSYLFAQAGIALPRMGVDQFVFGEEVELSKIQSGDLLFFNNGSKNVHLMSVEWFPGTPVPSGVDHVALFIGDGKIVHASGDAGNVVEEIFEKSLLRKNFVGARRISAIANKKSKRFAVTIPHERLDIRRPADLIEEIARLIGYESIKDKSLSVSKTAPVIHPTYSSLEKLRLFLVGEGFSEIYTYAFVSSGEVELQNPIASDKQFLRASLSPLVSRAIERNAINADLLGLDQVKVFEVGKIFNENVEKFSLAIGANVYRGSKIQKIEDDLRATLLNLVPEKLHAEIKEKTSVVHDASSVVLEIDVDVLLPAFQETDFLDEHFSNKKISLSENRFQKISPYPFIVRDIAVFVPPKTKEESVLKIILNQAGPLVVHHRLFDKFEKTFPDGSTKTSYAFRLVFQSSERTLNDEEVNLLMNDVSKTLSAEKDWQVR